MIKNSIMLDPKSNLGRIRDEKNGREPRLKKLHAKPLRRKRLNHRKF
jgi:hypothetical protein